MTIRKFMAAAALLGAAACRTDHTPHLPPEKMERVLLDIQLAEVYSTMAGRDSAQNTGIKSNDSLVVFYREVLAHHHISLQEFTRSLDWYRHHPDQLDTMYARAIDLLAKDEQAVMK